MTLKGVVVSFLFLHAVGMADVAYAVPRLVCHVSIDDAR